MDKIRGASCASSSSTMAGSSPFGHRSRVCSSLSYLPSFTLTFAYLLLSTSFVSVGPFVSINGHSLYKGTQLLLVEPLYWMEDFSSLLNKNTRRNSFSYGDSQAKKTNGKITEETCCDKNCGRCPEVTERLNQELLVKQRYAVILDGGSTGTRVQVFVFNKTVAADGHRALVLASDHFRQVKPGLSSFASAPSEAAQSLLPLLELVTSVVPEDVRSKTPMLLRATAGLRLLPAEAADAILSETYSLLSGFGFKMSTDSVSILDGASEGTYAWITVNSLLNRLHSPKVSVAVLDLGGGSTQLAFTPIAAETLSTSAEKIISKSIQGRDQHLYTHSYLGYGLMSARKSLLTYTFEDKSIFNNKELFLSHPCFSNEIPTIWTFENTMYHVNGSAGDCYALAVRFVEEVNQERGTRKIESPKELNQRVIYAISYYYDRAVDIGLVDHIRRRGTLRVKDFYYYAREVCGAMTGSALRRKAKMSSLSEADLAAKRAEMPFLCMDLSYVTALLREGFGLRWDKEIHLTSQLKGVEASWALGAAYDLFG